MAWILSTSNHIRSACSLSRSALEFLLSQIANFAMILKDLGIFAIGDGVEFVRRCKKRGAAVGWTSFSLSEMLYSSRTGTVRAVFEFLFCI